jgi:hypothetical protein
LSSGCGEGILHEIKPRAIFSINFTVHDSSIGYDDINQTTSIEKVPLYLKSSQTL